MFSQWCTVTKYFYLKPKSITVYSSQAGHRLVKDLSQTC